MTMFGRSLKDLHFINSYGGLQYIKPIPKRLLGSLYFLMSQHLCASKETDVI